MLLAMGVPKLSNTFEWPAGYAPHVITPLDNEYVVPLVSVGRVQLYDSKWCFLRGWHIDALGGDFKVECNPGGTIEVFTARGRNQYSFMQYGQPISAPKLASDSDFYSRPIEGIYGPGPACKT
jgi:hypothetical protein